MSKKFIKGNVYVFTKKKCKQQVKNLNLYSTWPNQINGNKVTIVSTCDGLVGGYGVRPEWCKCIRNNDPKIESEAI